MRKGFDALCGEVFIFYNTNRTRLKRFHWEHGGFVIYQSVSSEVITLPCLDDRTGGYRVAWRELVLMVKELEMELEHIRSRKHYNISLKYGKRNNGSHLHRFLRAMPRKPYGRAGFAVSAGRRFVSGAARSARLVRAALYGAGQSSRHGGKEAGRTASAAQDAVWTQVGAFHPHGPIAVQPGFEGVAQLKEKREEGCRVAGGCPGRP